MEDRRTQARFCPKNGCPSMGQILGLGLGVMQKNLVNVGVKNRKRTGRGQEEDRRTQS